MNKARKPLSRWKRFRHRIEGLALSLLAAVMPRLSRRTLLRITNTLGWIAYHVAVRERRMAMTNLDIAFGQTKSEEEKRQIVLSSFQAFARSTLGLFWAGRDPEQKLSNLVDFEPEGLRLVKECHARGKGIIFVTLHYNDWELLGLTTALCTIPLTIVTEQTRNPHVKQLLEQLRGATGNQMILQRSALTKLFKALKRGGGLGLLLDLNALPTRGGIWLEFFGKPVFSYSVAAGLAMHTGAAILGGTSYPLPDGRIKLVYGPEIPCVRTGNDEEDLRRISQDCLTYCETVIRQQPEHWLWFYRRWRFRPTPDADGFPYYSQYIEDARPRRATASEPEE